MKALYVFGVVASLLIGAGSGLTGCKRELPVQRSAAEEQDDEQIVRLVKEALSNSPTFKYPDVQVASYKGKVQLSGFVLTDDQKRAAGDAAKGVPGVVEVENKITIKQ